MLLFDGVLNGVSDHVLYQKVCIMSYGELMDDLNSTWRKVSGITPARSDDNFWVHTLANVHESLEALELSIPVSKPLPKKRGRKPKPKDRST